VGVFVPVGLGVVGVLVGVNVWVLLDIGVAVKICVKVAVELGVAVNCNAAYTGVGVPGATRLRRL
jgi:hypothetical protein